MGEAEARYRTGELCGNASLCHLSANNQLGEMRIPAALVSRLSEVKRNGSGMKPVRSNRWLGE